MALCCYVQIRYFGSQATWATVHIRLIDYLAVATIGCTAVVRASSSITFQWYTVTNEVTRVTTGCRETIWPILGVDRTKGSKYMTKTVCFSFWFFKIVWNGSGRNRPIGKVRLTLPHVTLEDRPRATSRSEVIDFTINNPFLEQGEALPHAPLVFTWPKSKSRPSTTLGVFGTTKNEQC